MASRLHFKALFGILFLIVITPGKSFSSDRHQATPDNDTQNALTATVSCLDIPDDGQRLECFETQARLIKAQLGSGELVPVYRSEIAEARRGLFGIERLRMPGFLGSEEQTLDEIETQIVSASRQNNGRWTFALGDGSQWDQIDASNPYFNSRAGAPVRIRRAALGSYLMTVGNSSAMRVSRKR